MLSFSKLPSDMQLAIQNNHKIEAIKIYRGNTFLSLREAKDFIEANWDRWRREMPQPEPAKQERNPAQLPKEQLLLKLLNMTTAAEDTVACVAIRKANELLASAGWSWEKLLSGKIVVVEDPFSKVPEIKRNPEDSIRTIRTPPPPQPRPPARPAPPPPPHAHRTPTRPPMPISNPGVGMQWAFDSISWSWTVEPDPNYRAPAPSKLGDRENRYSGFCYCCGTEVEANAGFIFQPTTFNSQAKHKWEIACSSCNTSVKTILSTRARRKFADYQSNSHVDLGQL